MAQVITSSHKKYLKQKKMLPMVFVMIGRGMKYIKYRGNAYLEVMVAGKYKTQTITLWVTQKMRHELAKIDFHGQLCEFRFYMMSASRLSATVHLWLCGIVVHDELTDGETGTLIQWSTLLTQPVGTPSLVDMTGTIEDDF